MKQTIDITLIVMLLTVWLLAFIGWFMNIVKLVSHSEAVGMSIGRGIGIIFPPLGAILGWF